MKPIRHTSTTRAHALPAPEVMHPMVLWALMLATLLLMSIPRLLMVDEPFLGLAPQVMEQMKVVFETLKAEGMAILFIEQNVRLALSMAGRGYILESGRLAIEGPAASLIDSPEVRRIFLGA